ncbi:hypothetical protein [Candidatus Frankia alpina]|uniref:hypothetical protein n=1 Tax=Candidatus Frankia alpina TaxID=2699483 RepID=UPI0013D45FE9|nr:hypothetical protein [Candidatus Frankia alpina]
MGSSTRATQAAAAARCWRTTSTRGGGQSAGELGGLAVGVDVGDLDPLGRGVLAGASEDLRVGQRQDPGSGEGDPSAVSGGPRRGGRRRLHVGRGAQPAGPVPGHPVQGAQPAVAGRGQLGGARAGEPVQLLGSHRGDAEGAGGEGEVPQDRHADADHGVSSLVVVLVGLVDGVRQGAAAEVSGSG